MDVEKKPAEHTPPIQPTIALALTEREATILNAALGHYWLHLKKDNEELHAALPTIQVLQREIVDQSRVPVLLPSSVAGIKHLMSMNRLILRRREHPPQSKEEEDQRRHAWVDARYWLDYFNVPAHRDEKTGLYRFGSLGGGMDHE
jgi:hypothetical protein